MKTIYLIQEMKAEEFKELTKKGCNLETLSINFKTTPLWCESTKEDAIEECREKNNKRRKNKIYFYTEIKLF